MIDALLPTRVGTSLPDRNYVRGKRRAIAVGTPLAASASGVHVWIKEACIGGVLTTYEVSMGEADAASGVPTKQSMLNIFSVEMKVAGGGGIGQAQGQSLR
jgi:hypothetical protein